MTDRVVAAVLFSLLYFGGLFLASELNASTIGHDAVIGPAVVAIIYAGMFAPAAITAVGTLLITRCSRRYRFILAVGFAFAFATLVHGMFVGWRSNAFGEALRRADLTFSCTRTLS